MVFTDVSLNSQMPGVAWIQEKWTKKFFTETIPMFAQERMLRKYGIVWIPNMAYTDKCINDAKHLLSQYYTITYVHRDDLLQLNPLYKATEYSADRLCNASEAATNANQLVSYLNYSDHPFIALQVLDWHAGAPPLDGDYDEDDEEEEEDDDDMQWDVEEQVEEEGQREEEEDLVSLPDVDESPAVNKGNTITSPSTYSVKRDSLNREIVCIDDDE